MAHTDEWPIETDGVNDKESALLRVH